MSTPTNPGWRVQLAIHRAVRRDTSRLARAIGAGDAVPAAAVRAYWAAASAQLHHHHQFEDAVVWPLMGERLGDRVAALLARNGHEHEAMASAMDALDAALGATVAAAGTFLAHLQEVVDVHLAHEEADVLPLIPEAFTLEDIAFFQAEDAKTNAPSAFLPWMLDDATEEDLEFFTGHMPPPVREQLDSEWRPRWGEIAGALAVQAPVAAG